MVVAVALTLFAAVVLRSSPRVEVLVWTVVVWLTTLGSTVFYILEVLPGALTVAFITWFRRSRKRALLERNQIREFCGVLRDDDAYPLNSWSVKDKMDLSPVLRQMVKTHFSLNGELSHGVIT